MYTELFTKNNPEKINKAVLVNRKLLPVLISLICLFGFMSCNNQNGKKFEDLILVCGDSKVLIAKAAKSNDTIPEIIWSWDAHIANDLPGHIKPERFNTVDDC